MKSKIQLGLILLAFIVTGFGIYRGEHSIVLRKAVNICLECIGVG